MVGGIVAIGDFMLMLLTSALWVGAGVLGLAALGCGTLGGLAFAARRWWRMR